MGIGVRGDRIHGFELSPITLVGDINARPGLDVANLAVCGDAGLPILLGALEVAHDAGGAVQAFDALGFGIHQFHLNDVCLGGVALALRKAQDVAVAREVQAMAGGLDGVGDARIGLPLVLDEGQGEPAEVVENARLGGAGGSRRPASRETSTSLYVGDRRRGLWLMTTELTEYSR